MSVSLVRQINPPAGVSGPGSRRPHVSRCGFMFRARMLKRSSEKLEEGTEAGFCSSGLRIISIIRSNETVLCPLSQTRR